MPTKTTKKPANAKRKTSDLLLEEVRELRESIDDLHHEIHKLAPPTALAKAARNFLSGIVRGFGFVLGTTAVAALLIYFVQQSFESGWARNWINEQVRGAITESIDDYTPGFLQRD